MHRRRPRRPAVGDVAIVRLFETESHQGQPYWGDVYIVGLVDGLRLDGEILRVDIGVGYMDRSSRWRGAWSEQADHFEVDRLRDRLKRNHPGSFLRLNEVRFFLDEYRVGRTPAPRVRSPTREAKPEAWQLRGVVSLEVARRMKAAGFPQYTRWKWCLASRSGGEPAWRVQKTVGRAREWAAAPSALEISDWLPAEIVVDGEVYSPEFGVQGSQFEAMYPGLRVEHGGTIADAVGRLLLWLVDRGVIRGKH